MGFWTATRSLIKGKTTSTWIQVFRYLVVSGLSLIVDFTVLATLTEVFGLHYLASAAISYSVGLVVNYVLSVLWVFHSSKMDSRPMEFIVFTMIGVSGLGLNELILWSFSTFLGIHYLLSRGVSAVIGYAWKYIARRIFLFR